MSVPTAIHGGAVDPGTETNVVNLFLGDARRRRAAAQFAGAVDLIGAWHAVDLATAAGPCTRRQLASGRGATRAGVDDVAAATGDRAVCGQAVTPACPDRCFSVLRRITGGLLCSWCGWAVALRTDGLGDELDRPSSAVADAPPAYRTVVDLALMVLVSYAESGYPADLDDTVDPRDTVGPGTDPWRPPAARVVDLLDRICRHTPPRLLGVACRRGGCGHPTGPEGPGDLARGRPRHGRAGRRRPPRPLPRRTVLLRPAPRTAWSKPVSSPAESPSAPAGDHRHTSPLLGGSPSAPRSSSHSRTA